MGTSAGHRPLSADDLESYHERGYLLYRDQVFDEGGLADWTRSSGNIVTRTGRSGGTSSILRTSRTRACWSSCLPQHCSTSLSASSGPISCCGRAISSARTRWLGALHRGTKIRLTGWDASAGTTRSLPCGWRWTTWTERTAACR